MGIRKTPKYSKGELEIDASSPLSNAASISIIRARFGSKEHDFDIQPTYLRRHMRWIDAFSLFCLVNHGLGGFQATQIRRGEGWTDIFRLSWPV